MSYYYLFSHTLATLTSTPHASEVNITVYGSALFTQGSPKKEGNRRYGNGRKIGIGTLRESEGGHGRGT